MTFCLKLVGIPLDFSIQSKNQSPRLMKWLVPLFGLTIVVANFVFNGSRGIEIDQLKFMNNVQDFESPFTYFKFNPFGIVKLVKLMSEMIFFCYVPFIHVAFMATVLFDPNWKKLVVLLEKIQREMKLDEEFHRKCRLHCLIALLSLLAVSYL